MEEHQDGEHDMMDASTNPIPNGSDRLIEAVNGECRQVFPQGTGLRLTITPEKIDRVIADVQTQIEGLQDYLANLRLARAHIVLLQVKEGGKECHGVGPVPAPFCDVAIT